MAAPAIVMIAMQCIRTGTIAIVTTIMSTTAADVTDLLNLCSIRL